MHNPHEKMASSSAVFFNTYDAQVLEDVQN